MYDNLRSSTILHFEVPFCGVYRRLVNLIIDSNTAYHKHEYIGVGVKLSFKYRMFQNCCLFNQP